MSEPVRMSAAPTQAEKIRQAASEWLIRRRDDEAWNDADQLQLDRWLAESPAHMIAYWRLEDVWSKADRLGALRRPAPDKADEPMLRPLRGLLRGLAAITILAALGGGTGFYLLMPRAQTYETPLGGREILTLKDGSHIELNTNTVVRIADGADKRAVWLDRGEAYFEVKHDPARPFVVTAGDHRVTDLGTKFVMRRDDTRLQVAVVEGDVRFNPGGASQHRSTILMAGDVAIATADAVVVSKKTTGALAEELGWRTGVLVFHHTTLGDAAAEFNRYNQEKLVVADPHVARLRLGGTFPTGNVEGFADSAKEILGLRVEKRDGETIISR
jgi:transmembrane sensor